MTFKQFLIVLRARWRLVLSVLFSVVALAGAYSALLPKQYAATASVVVDLRTPDPIAGTVMQGMMIQSYLATQADVIQSERVAVRALRSLGLQNSTEYHALWLQGTGGAGEFEPWLAETLLKKLETKPSRESNVLNIAYTAGDPKMAADMANAFVQAYIDTTLDLRVEPAKRYNSFFDERAKELRAGLEAAQARLSAFQQSKGMIATDERLDVENSRLAELSSQYVALQAIAAESRSIKSQPASDTDKLQAVISNPVVSGLQADIARGEAKLNELRSRLGEDHPQMVELRANIAQLRTRLASETQRVSGSLTVSDTVNQSRLGSVRASLDDQRSRVLKLKGQRDEAAVLLRDVESAQRAYDAVLTRASQTSLESENRQTNVAVLKRASPPPKPSSPKLGLNLSIALVLGTLLAVAIALVREFSDRRLRGNDDVFEVLHQPLLGVLPLRERGAASLGRTRARLLGDQVIGVLPQPTPK